MKQTRTHTFKKTITLILLAIMLIGSLSMLTACNENNVSNCTRHPNSDVNIDTTLENSIRKAFSSEHYSVWYIIRYYGTFNGASVVMMGSNEFSFPDIVVYEVVAGITFSYPTCGNFILVWHSNLLFRLQKAYEQYILTIADLQIILSVHNTR